MGGWQIIKFPDENNMVEAVPSSWVFKEGEQMFCFWPNAICSSKVATAIKSQEIPKSDWRRHKVEVMSNHAYDSFILADKKAKKAQYASSLESDTDNREEIEPSKRLRKQNKRFLSSSEEEYSPLLKKPPRRSPRFQLPTPPKVPDRSQASLLKVRQNLEGVLSSVVSKQSFNSATTLSGCSRAQTQSQNQNVNLTNSTGACCHGEDFAQIIKMIHIINGKLSELNKMTLTLLNNEVNHGPSVTTNVDENRTECNIDLKLPATSVMELLEIDAKMDDKNVKEFLVKSLLHVGGDNVKDVLKRIVPKVVNDEVLKEYSWIGGKGKKKFSMLNLSSVIKDVCKGNRDTKMETEKKVEATLAVYLAKATERCNRKMNKENLKALDEVGTSQPGTCTRINDLNV